MASPHMTINYFFVRVHVCACMHVVRVRVCVRVTRSHSPVLCSVSNTPITRALLVVIQPVLIELSTVEGCYTASFSHGGAQASLTQSRSPRCN